MIVSFPGEKEWLSHRQRRGAHRRITIKSIRARNLWILFDSRRRRGQKIQSHSMADRSVYQVSNLSFSYGEAPVLHGISTSIANGDFVAVVGPNGAGKSTFLKILAGLSRGYSGSVEFNAVPLSGIPPRELARKVAFVPQDTHIVFPFTVSQIVLMGRLPHQAKGLFDSGADADQAELAMRSTGTLHLAGKTFNQLSGGERQRVVLASALAQEPEVLLLDEPTVYLDLKHQIHFYDIVEWLNVERGMTIVSVTHDVNLAAWYARRMIAVRAGVFVADGTPDSVLTPVSIHDIFDINATVLRRPDDRGVFIVPQN
jgi:iron complex transport system ATP-binding protein